MSYMVASLYEIKPEVSVDCEMIHLRIDGFRTYVGLDLDHAEKLQRELAEAIATLREAEKAEAA